MKKHTNVRFIGLSAWKKILCTLMAASLLLLMIPNGVFAYAAGNDDSNGEVNSQSANVENQVQGQRLSAGDLEPLGSSVTFDPKSFNMGQTTGYFTVQTAKITVEQIIYWAVNSNIRSYLTLTENADGTINQEDVANYLAAILATTPYIPFDQLDYYEEEAHGSYTVDMQNALDIPDYVYDALEDVLLHQGLIPPEYALIALEASRYLFNSIIPSNTKLGDLPISLPNPALVDDWPLTNDGALYMFNLYMGEGDDGFLNMLTSTYIRITRVIPNTPTQIYDSPFTGGNNFRANSDEANENVQPYFMSWDIDLFNLGFTVPLTWLQDYYGPLQYELLGEKLTLLNYKPLRISKTRQIHCTANFYDIPGLVPVHIDFGGAYVNEPFRKALRADGWTSTDFVNGSTWTKSYWEQTPTWYVYSDIFEKFGAWIYGGDKKSTTFTDTRSQVWKDEIIWHDYWYYKEKVGDFAYFNEWDAPFAGPWWFETDNQNWAGNIGKETTVTFSAYPISPRGHVVHEGHGDNIWEYLFNVADTVENATVMFYNEYDLPLFSWYDQGYDRNTKYFMDEQKGYYFVDTHNQDDVFNYTPQYCFDVQIDHAIVFASDEGSSTGRVPDTYIPLKVTWEQFDRTFSTFYDYGYIDFSVERMMFADLETYGAYDNIESFEVNFFEDGQKLFDTYIIDQPWQMAMFKMPMVTNGTITTWRNTLVTGWTCFLDFNNPFGSTDALNTFQNMDNFTVTDEGHHYQCQIIAHPKAGFEFSTWYLDNEAISTTDDNPIIAKEHGSFAEHAIRPGFIPAA